METPISTILTEREQTHGSFDKNSSVAQQIKNVVRDSGAKLTPTQREALDFIASKIGRICSGNAGERDHWADIAGYATLVADRCQPEHPELPLVSSSILTPPPGWRRMEGHERVDTVSRLFSEHGYVTPHTSWLGKMVSDLYGQYITPDWHNPEDIPSPGEGYRFLLTSESETDSTDFWTGYNWMDDDGNGHLSSYTTYRTNKPLPCPPHNTTS